MFDRDAVLAAVMSFLLAAYVLIVTGGAAFAQDDRVLIDDVDASGFPTVVVSVTGPAALAGVALTADNVQILENGEGREPQVTAVPTDDLEVVLLIDTSGSMAGAPIERARAAVLAFIDRMPPSTRMSVVGFGVDTAVLTDFTADRDQLRAAVDRLVVAGDTALYDAVVSAASLFEPRQDSQRRVVIVSDGGDTASGAPIDVPLALLNGSDIEVQVISLVTTESDPSSLQALAAAGNGRVVEASDPAALASVFDAVASALVNRYQLAFVAEIGGDAEIEVAVETLLHQSSDTVQAVLPLVVTPTPEPTSAPTASSASPPTVVDPEPDLAAPVTRLPSGGASWLYPVGLAAMFGGLAGFFWFVTRPGRRQNLLRSLAPAAVESTAIVGGWLRGTPGFITRLASGALSRKGRERRLELELSRAGIELRPAEMLLLSAVAVTLAVLVGLLAGGWILAVTLGGLTYLIIRLVLRYLGKRRQDAFAEQLHGVLTMMAGSLRSGYSVTQSIDTVAREVNAPASVEFNRALIEVQLGRDLTDAFDAVADRTSNEDFRWVVEAIDISRSVGGDLGEVLDNVAKTIRDRDRVARHVRTLSAEGRLSAWILSALPFLMAAYLAVVNPEYLSTLTDTRAGHIVMAITGAVVAVGIIWMRRLVRPEF